MRTRLSVLAMFAVALLATSAQAGDGGNPFEEPAPSTDLPALPELAPLRPLPDLAPLPELPPLDLAPTHLPTLSPPPAFSPPPALSLPSEPPPLLSLSATSAAVLGQYDEYKRPVPAYSIDRDPVSVAAYSRCTAAGSCSRPSCAPAHGAEGRVTCIDLAQAKAYCDFAGERLPSEDEWEHAARTATQLGMRAIDDAAEWTATPYCFFCGKDDQVVRGGPARNPALRGWRSPQTHDASVGFRCAKSG